MIEKQDITLIRGKTYAQVVRWETSPLVYKPITAIAKTAPVSITCTGHGAPDGWRIAISGVIGMNELNASYAPPDESDYHQATVPDANTIELNDIDASLFNTYVSGGFVVYKTPVDLNGYTARMAIRRAAGGTLYETLTTENGGIALDNSAKTISLFISDSATAAYTWIRGKYDLELISPASRVYLLMYGTVKVEKEITT